MNKIYKVAFLLSVVVISSIVLNGCKKDWLTPKPLSIYSPENTLVNIDGFRAALAGCNKTVRSEYFGDGAPIITELIFSEIAVDGTNDKSGPAQNMDISITPDAQLNHVDFNRIGWFWTYGYTGIRQANTIITRLPNVAGISDADKAILMGQAYFYRAYWYYRLTNQFGDVPCPTKEIFEAKTDYVTVKREVILARMKADLETAVKSVPVTTDKGDVNRGACYHLLTKINLALGLFDDAIVSATAVINGGFSLMTGRFGADAGITSKNVTWDLHRPDNKSLAANKEGIFLVTDRLGSASEFVDKDMNGGTGTDPGSRLMRQALPGVSISTTILTPSGKAGMTASGGVEIDIMNIYGRGIGRARNTPYHYKDIWDDANDFRHDSTSGNWLYPENLRYNNPALKTQGDTAYGLRLRLRGPTGNLLVDDTLRKWFPWPHYKLFVPDPQHNPQQGGHTDWYVFRLAETYLLRAEAYMWKNDKASAVADINKVRQRANCAAYSAAQVTMETILDERARELYWEEPRKTELTRIAYLYAKTGIAAYNGKTYTVANFSTSNYAIDRTIDKNIFYKTNFKTLHQDIFRISQYHVLWPVPQSAILANTDNHINQNIGYSGAASNVTPSDKIVD